MTLIIDIINYMAVIAALYFGYRICIARIKGRKFGELKPLLYSFAISLAIIWTINVFVGFVK